LLINTLPKVSIIQNRLQRGGRLQVMIYMIQALNNKGIIPEIITLSSRISQNDIDKNYFTKKLKYKIVEIAKDFRMPFEWNILYFNLIVNKYLYKYDLVINNNNTSFFLKKSFNLISYTHFPRKARNLSLKRSIHFPNGPNKSLWDYKSDLFCISSMLYKKDTKISQNELIIANSNFTKSNILKFYDIEPDQIKVLYPPVVDKKYNIQNRNNNIVISIGRFSPDKRQLEQIRIAKKLNNYFFYLVGFVNSENYYKKCEDYIKLYNIKNVTLAPNASKDFLSDILMKSNYFIHSLRNEPFGITTVQAINNGLIPVVHNSGGQKEVVTFEELRYKNIQQAVDIFQKLLRLSDSEKDSYVYNLKKNTELFSTTIFLKKFEKILSEKINIA